MPPLNSLPENLWPGVMLQITSVEPKNPRTGQMWVSRSGEMGAAGVAMGVMGLTYSQKEVGQYQLNVSVSPTERIGVRLYRYGR